MKTQKRLGLYFLDLESKAQSFLGMKPTILVFSKELLGCSLGYQKGFGPIPFRKTIVLAPNLGPGIFSHQGPIRIHKVPLKFEQTQEVPTDRWWHFFLFCFCLDRWAPNSYKKVETGQMVLVKEIFGDLRFG